MSHRCAILDDYQNVALQSADWSRIAGDVELRVFNDSLGAGDRVIAALQGFSILCLMRERTLFDRQVIEGLPNLKLLVTSGMRNAAIDLEAAAARNVVVCGTESAGNPTAELACGLMLELARKIGFENARLKQGARWQSTLGIELNGKTLGVVGLGKLGSAVAAIGKALNMRVVAWSQNLTEEKCQAAGASLVSKEDLFRQSDFITVHLQLSARTRGLVGRAEFALMKPTAFFVNTSRGPIVDEPALLDVLQSKKIAGAGIDVYDVEPLPLEHPLRKLDNAVLTPHLGYVTAENYRRFYGQMVEDVRAWLDGKPVRVMKAR
jgi:D-3-phosphoglycerate dehydrogenase